MPRTAAFPAPHRNAMLAVLPAKSFAALHPHMRLREVPPGTPLWGHGEGPAQVYFPLSGIIQVTLAVKEAGLVEVAKIGREAAAGALGGSAAAATCGTALTYTVFAFIPATKFREVANWDKAVGEATQEACGWIAAQAQQLCACNASHLAPQRLARWLLAVGDHVTGDWFDATQETMAVALGLRRTTVTKVAQGMAAEGLIAYRRGHMRIGKRDRLKACACECYAALSPQHWPFRQSGTTVAPPVAIPTARTVADEVA